MNFSNFYCVFLTLSPQTVVFRTILILIYFPISEIYQTAVNGTDANAKQCASAEVCVYLNKKIVVYESISSLKCNENVGMTPPGNVKCKVQIGASSSYDLKIAGMKIQ